MKTVSHLAELRQRGFGHVVVACGVFDGVHRGHQSILSSLGELAEECGCDPVVVTFHPHPRSLLQPGCAPALLTTSEQKTEQLLKHGAAAVVALPFSRELASLSPRAFLTGHLLSDAVRVAGVCVGAAWRFGARGSGTTTTLRELGQELGFRVVSVSEGQFYGKAISSTRIRRALDSGRVHFARRLLGRPHTVRGVVEHGKGIGGTRLNYPTANLQIGEQILLPRDGVYAARARFGRDSADKKAAGGIAYVGTAPTVPTGLGEGERRRVFEFHRFDFDGNLYGRSLDVELIDFIRGDETFADLEALREQISQDVIQAKSILKHLP
ncbi:MAG: riboflavin biosynthesis protein RibF [Lentisphaerae bacterium]|jgi:riboflavin kinase / FMN adenylyltransferase|nr:riboflavin biosynthesis protein RibF [Lentisphaerota bacterium]MBT4821328.1 riboflavin biosynthesis protein RibF [Lentisphaerota bacterium]MBT5610438.1 riboflavin biosynthesis protein RibF [Lentisphaerota bacterium]MBT7061029.1 riboflavin biosynthesis protein RibF [Lentisphaerota bacterium]MBT7842186.1 riboflavin biosynthesis protein RibF [Lentisphaerota bacterium]